MTQSVINRVLSLIEKPHKDCWQLRFGNFTIKIRAILDTLGLKRKMDQYGTVWDESSEQ